jgi:ribosomal protein L29
MKKREELNRLHELTNDDLLGESLLALGEVDAVKRIREEKKSLARINTLKRARAKQVTAD